MTKYTEQLNFRVSLETRAKLEALGNTGDSQTCPCCKQHWDKKELHLGDSQRILPTTLARQILEKEVDKQYRKRFGHD